jgi:hypothetical protein
MYVFIFRIFLYIFLFKRLRVFFGWLVDIRMVFGHVGVSFRGPGTAKSGIIFSSLYILALFTWLAGVAMELSFLRPCRFYLTQLIEACRYNCSCVTNRCWAFKTKR